MQNKVLKMILKHEKSDSHRNKRGKKGEKWKRCLKNTSIVSHVPKAQKDGGHVGQAQLSGRCQGMPSFLCFHVMRCNTECVPLLHYCSQASNLKVKCACGNLPDKCINTETALKKNKALNS